MPTLDEAFAAFDALNAQDPNVEVDEVGEARPKELLYAERMSRCLDAFNPNASDALRLACRAQHLERWRYPRADFPSGRAGYLKWRSDAKKEHSRRAIAVLQGLGYAGATRERVAVLIEKRGLRRDGEVQCLEDVVCLVFLRFYWQGFRQKHEDEKLVDVVRKTWAKMSEAAQAEALGIKFDERSLQLFRQAGLLS